MFWESQMLLIYANVLWGIIRSFIIADEPRHWFTAVLRTHQESKIGFTLEEDSGFNITRHAKFPTQAIIRCISVYPNRFES